MKIGEGFPLDSAERWANGVYN